MREMWHLLFMRDQLSISVMLFASLLLFATRIHSEEVDPSRIVADSVSYVRSIPPCHFNYTIATGISKRKIEFFTDGVRFSFTERKPDSNEVLKAFSFDGKRYYSFSEYILETSVDAKNFEDFVRSWFGYNPLFNQFKYIFPNRELITPDNLGLPKFWESADLSNRLVSSLPRVTTAMQIPDQINGKYLLGKFRGNNLVTDSAVGRPAPDYCEIWRIMDAKAFGGNEATIFIPTRIQSRVTRDDDSQTPYSYEITLDDKSFFLLKDTKSIRFDVPLSLGSEVFDKDLNILIKQDDWKP